MMSQISNNYYIIVTIRVLIGGISSSNLWIIDRFNYPLSTEIASL